MSAQRYHERQLGTWVVSTESDLSTITEKQSGTRAYAEDTGQWYTYNSSTGVWNADKGVGPNDQLHGFLSRAATYTATS